MSRRTPGGVSAAGGPDLASAVTAPNAVVPPASATPRSVPSPAGPTRVENDELDELHRGLRRGFLIGVIAWPVFYLLDLYAVFVYQPGASLAWLSLWRAIGIGVIAAFYLAFRGRRLAPATLRLVEGCYYATPAALIAIMAIGHGGLTSGYLHGISVVVTVHAMTIHARWRRAVVMLSLTALTYPAVMAIAATAVPEIRADWAEPRRLGMFLHDYAFVVGTVVLGAVISHMLWAARVQVYQARRLGRYRLKSRIGAGGMGEIWLARDDDGHRDVALKILDPAAATRPGALPRFEREARAAASLDHPHTIRVFDFGASDDGVAYLAMELLDGVDLGRQVAEHGPLPSDRAIRLARQACAGLAHAHARGIVHRDIKPENLFVTRAPDGGDHVKLLDFGIAKMTEGTLDATLTQAGWVAGTPAYMAPEVCTGGTADVRSDLYSLGAVLYFMVTGTPPYVEPDAHSVMRAHVDQPLVPPSLRAPAPLPIHLERAILACLAKLPAERPAGADALDALLAAR